MVIPVSLLVWWRWEFTDQWSFDHLFWVEAAFSQNQESKPFGRTIDNMNSRKKQGDARQRIFGYSLVIPHSRPWYLTSIWAACECRPTTITPTLSILKLSDWVLKKKVDIANTSWALSHRCDLQQTDQLQTAIQGQNWEEIGKNWFTEKFTTFHLLWVSSLLKDVITTIF